MRIYRKLTNIQNVAPGKTAQIICPVRYTYDKIQLAYTGTAIVRSHLTNITVECNGEPVQTYKDGDRLDQYNDYYGRADTAGYLTIYFNRPEMKTFEDERICGLGTADLTNLVVKIDIAAGAPADIGITAEAQLSDPQPLGLFTRVKTVNYNSAVSGQVDVDKISVGPRILAIHCFKSDISAVEVYLDEAKVYEASKTVGEVFQKEVRPVARVPQTAVATHIDWGLEGDLAQAMVTQSNEPNRPNKDLLIKPTLTTSGAVDFLVEYLDGLKQAA